MVGKPSSVFFETAVKDIGVKPESVSMNTNKNVNRYNRKEKSCYYAECHGYIQN